MEMSAFMNMQAQKMRAESSVAPPSKPSSAHSTPSQSLTSAPAHAAASKAKGSTPVSCFSTPATTPPLKPLKHNSPMPSAPTQKISPRLMHAEGKRPSVASAAHSAPSRSPSVSSSDSDEDFVYMLESVKTTEEAVERIRAVQQPNDTSMTSFFKSGLAGSAANPADVADNSPHKTQAAQHKMKGGLPATMEEFYECPRYTVSLTAAREAIFSDALSGFHSYVEREKAQREQLRALQHHHHHHHNPHAPHTGKAEGRAGSDSVSTLLSFSSGATAEWNAALAATATPLPEKARPAPARATGTAALNEKATALPAFTPSEERKQGTASTSAAAPSSATASVPLHVSGEASLNAATSTLSSPPLTTDSTAATTTSGKDSEGASQHLSASYMFIMRSRDTEAMSPVSSPRPSPEGNDFAKRSFAEDGAPTRMMSPPEDQTHTAGASHVDPEGTGRELAGAAGAPASSTAIPASQPASTVKPAPNPEQAAKLEAMQLQTLLQERIYQRVRVPVVFRCRYALEFAETREEHQERMQLRERVLRTNERLAGPGGLSHAMRQRIRDRYPDPNTVAPEWPYVWEQFVRDIPRETLFIEDSPHRDAEDALAAILSYVEYCYDRGQQNVRQRLEKALADANKAGVDMAVRERSASPPPPASKPKGFFESLFSASSAAIKGAVVTVRSSLPDFVGDPLLTVSGLDPALYHTSLLFPTDPKARSEKIFSAVREVVLASQQSFMGFPYQLLCEQVGTERLGLALEALELDQEDEEDSNVEENPTDAAKSNEEQQQRQNSADVSTPIPIRRADESDSELRREASTSSMRSPLLGSRVVRIYQSFSSSAVLNDNADGRRRRGHSTHGIDEWNVSSSSSSSRASEDADSLLPPAVEVPASKPSADHLDEVHDASDNEEGKGAGEKTPLPAVRPPPLQGLAVCDGRIMPDTASSAPAPAPPLLTRGKPHHDSPSDKLARRRRERRRRRRNQLPLLVGEPRPHEFAIFLDILRARVAAKTAKEEKKMRERQRRERVHRLVERQREQWHSATNSRVGSRCTSSTSLDAMAKPNGNSALASAIPPPPIKSTALFREDVEGSAYLLPTQPTAAKGAAVPVPSSPLAASMLRQTTAPPEIRGMRICLFFDEPRGVPVVVVNKLFRLFTMPGLRGMTSSSGEEAEEEEETRRRLEGHEEAALNAQGINSGVLPRARSGKFPVRKTSEKSLLLLIQVQFSLFSKEEAEVRWKWWKV